MFFLLPEGSCGRFCILSEDLQSLWKHKYGVRGSPLSLRNHIKRAASYWTHGHSQPGVWVLVSSLAGREKGHKACISLSAWFNKDLSPLPLLTWKHFSTVKMTQTSLKDRRMCRSQKMPHMPSEIRVPTPDAGSLVYGKRIRLVIRSLGLISFVTSGKSFTSLGCFLISKIRNCLADLGASCGCRESDSTLRVFVLGNINLYNLLKLGMISDSHSQIATS